MKLKFDGKTKTIIDTRCPEDKILNGGNISVCYTLISDDITKGEKPSSTPFIDRKGEFSESYGTLRCEDIDTTLSVTEEEIGLLFELESKNPILSEFGVNLPFNFMGKKDGGGWRRQFLFNSPYASQDGQIIYAYLTKPNGNNIVVAIKGGADGWKMDYSPYLGGHYFINLKLLSNFDKVYKTQRRKHLLTFAIIPVSDFDDCLQKLAAFYGVPFMDYDRGGGCIGSEIELKFYGKVDGFLEITGNTETMLPCSDRYKIKLAGETKLIPVYKGKRGAESTVYGYKNIIELYKMSMNAVDMKDVEVTDGNLCEHQCWAPAMLRFLSHFKNCLSGAEVTEYENKIKQLLDVVTETDETKAKEGITIFAFPQKEFPAYNIYGNNRIQEEFFGITLLLDAYRYFGDEKYFDYAIKTTDSLLENYQKEDGRLERCNNGVWEDYTTVCCPMIPLVDMANFLADKDPIRSEKYFEAASKMAEYLFCRGLSFPTEGGVAVEAEAEMEDGSISCTALALLYYCKNVKKVQKYIEKAKEILDIHESWVIKTPICQMHGSSLRWWETQWEGDADGPAICAGHAWTIWRAEADYLYFALTGDKQHLLKSYNGFMTNLSKIHADGKSYSIYNPDMINGGGFHGRAEEIRFEIARKFARQADSGLSRYVWIRINDTSFLDGLQKM